MRAKILSALLIILLIAPSSARAEENVGSSLTADELHYDPRSAEISAVGSVRFTRRDGGFSSDRATGASDGSFIRLEGNVRGTVVRPDGEITIECGELLVTQGEDEERLAHASGGVVIAFGDDRITAGSAAWRLGEDDYAASGDVFARFGGLEIEADSLSRTGAEFIIDRVKRYRDPIRDMEMSCTRAIGRIDRDGAIVETVARGDVVIKMRDSSDNETTITGMTGVYSIERGTVVVSGGAQITQFGRRLSAGSVVYDLENGRIDAIDRPTLTIDIEDQ